MELASVSLLTFPDADSDTNAGTDIRPKNVYSSDWGSESESMQCEHELHSTNQPLVWIPNLSQCLNSFLAIYIRQ